MLDVHRRHCVERVPQAHRHLQLLIRQLHLAAKVLLHHLRQGARGETMLIDFAKVRSIQSKDSQLSPRSK